jgi:hypothetical protein
MFKLNKEAINQLFKSIFNLPGGSQVLIIFQAALISNNKINKFKKKIFF